MGKHGRHKPTGTSRSTSEWFTMTKTDALTENIMEDDTSRLYPFVLEDEFCISGGKERGLAGTGFTKSSLPNAANSKARPRTR